MFLLCAGGCAGANEQFCQAHVYAAPTARLSTLRVKYALITVTNGKQDGRTRQGVRSLLLVNVSVGLARECGRIIWERRKSSSGTSTTRTTMRANQNGTYQFFLRARLSGIFYSLILRRQSLAPELTLKSHWFNEALLHLLQIFFVSAAFCRPENFPP